MNTFNKVKSLIEAGHWVACKHKDGYYKVFTFVREGNGDVYLEGTIGSKNITDCLRGGLFSASWHESIFNHSFTDEYEVVPRKPKVLSDGTRVRILPIAREMSVYNTWFDEEKDMVGNIYQIDDVLDYSSGVHYAINGYRFPHYCVEEIFEDGPTEEELDNAQKLLEKAGRIIIGKIVK